MGSFVLRRLLAAVLVMVVVAAITFTMLHVLRPESFFDPRPLGTQLVEYLERVFLHFDFGRVRGARHLHVSDLVRDGLPASLSLLIGAVLVGTGAGIAAGAYCGARAGRLAARVVEAVAIVALCAPVYWVGLMLLVAFAPVGGHFDAPIDIRNGNYAPLTDDPKQWLDSMVVPWIVLGAPLFGMCVRMMRSSTLEALDQDFVRTAAAKGLSASAVVRRHVVPAGAAPTVSLAGANMAFMVTNLVLVEQIFNVPGVFRVTTGAMADGEFEVLQALVIVGALLVVAGNLVVDIVLAWLDPRIRASSV